MEYFAFLNHNVSVYQNIAGLNIVSRMSVSCRTKENEMRWRLGCYWLVI